MDEGLRLQAREFLLRCRVYRFMALCFAGVGFVIFLFLYFKNVEGNFLQALKEPATVLMVLIPFLPAFLLTRMSAKAEKKFFEIMGKSMEDPKK